MLEKLKVRLASIKEKQLKGKPIKRKLSLRSKLVITFVIILFGPVLSVSILSYQTAKDEVSDQMLGGAEQNVKLLDSVINQYTLAERANADYLSSLITENTYIGAEQTLQSKILNPFWKTHPSISSIEFSGPSGYYRNVQGEEWAHEGDALSQPWIQDAMETSEAIISAPYVSDITGDFVVGISKAVADGSGVVRSEVKIDELTGLADAVQIGNEGYALILDSERRVVVHPTLEAGVIAEGDWVDQLFAAETGQFNYIVDGQSMTMSYTTNLLSGWKIGGTLITKELAQAAKPILNQTMLVVIISVLVAGVLIYYILRNLFKSLRIMVKTAEKISKGDLSARIPLEGDDELGKLSSSFNKMAASIHRSMSSINETALSLASSSQELSASAEQAAKATEHIADSAQSIHEGASKQEIMLAENHERISSISDRMNDIDGYVTQLDELTSEAGARSLAGSDNVQAVVRQMSVINDFTEQQSKIISGLNDQSHQIDQIVRVIQEIASRTNLLALNASIEAARAGEHGRGFAVVATEIRKLAEQTTNSTGSIKDLIGQIQVGTLGAVSSMEQTVSEVGKGIQVVHETDRNFKGILQAVSPLAEMSSTLRAITSEIAVQASQMAESVNNVIRIAGENAGGTESVSASVEEQLASMEQISASAAHLSKTADELSAIVDIFKV
jgi:methyl-accepting chemotaxis protein